MQDYKTVALRLAKQADDNARTRIRRHNKPSAYRGLPGYSGMPAIELSRLNRLVNRLR